MTSSKRDLGAWGEAQAARFLARQGYTLIGQNVRTPYGEIDLIARNGQTTVFVEVKTRASPAFGLPEEAITPAKQAHLIASAEAFLNDHPELAGPWRIDVIAIRQRTGQKPEIVHFENAVGG